MVSSHNSGLAAAILLLQELQELVGVHGEATLASVHLVVLELALVVSILQVPLDDQHVRSVGHGALGGEEALATHGQRLTPVGDAVVGRHFHLVQLLQVSRLVDRRLGHQVVGQDVPHVMEAVVCLVRYTQ